MHAHTRLMKFKCLSRGEIECELATQGEISLHEFTPCDTCPISLRRATAVMAQSETALRAEFASVCDASTHFKQGLDTVRGIAQQVRAYALPDVAFDSHRFRFGEQWKFASVEDNA